jgi:hypothetical protein
VVSAFWGGSKNPDGSKKRAKLPPDEAEVRGKEVARKRAERKASLKARFLEHRAAGEKRKEWEGPRKFEEWLFALAEQEMRPHERARLASHPNVLGPDSSNAVLCELWRLVQDMYDEVCIKHKKSFPFYKRRAKLVGIELKDHPEDYE